MDDVWREQWRDTYIPCTCAECGKVFFPPVKEQWVFRRYILRSNRAGKQTEHLFCSWGCMRKYDREFVPPASHRGRRKKEATA